MKRLGAAACVALAGTVALVGAATPAAAQIGALAAAAAVSGAGSAAGDDYALSGAPIFSESGLILTEGWSANAFGVSVMSTQTFSDGQFSDDFETTISQMTIGAFLSVGDRAMIGAVLEPYLSLEQVRLSDDASASASGLGNLTLFGKLSLTESANGRTRLAATASVELPTGDEMVSSSATSFSAGVGASHQLDAKTSVHGGGSVNVAGGTDGVDGSTGVGFSGAVVRQLSPRGWLAGELLASAGDGEWQLLLAPAGRIRANDKLFVDLGLAFALASSEGIVPIDLGFAAGITYVPGS